MNGSGLLLLNTPWQFDATLRAVLPLLRDALGQHGANTRVDWLRAPE
jgi:23S rRNA (adenine2030-N6)-methyltransferase